MRTNRKEGREVDDFSREIMKALQQSKDPWERFAREGYVNSRLAANHKYTRDAVLIVEDRIKKLEKKVATQRKIAPLVCAIILIEKVFRLLVQHRKYHRQ